MNPEAKLKLSVTVKVKDLYPNLKPEQTSTLTLKDITDDILDPEFFYDMAIFANHPDSVTVEELPNASSNQPVNASGN